MRQVSLIFSFIFISSMVGFCQQITGKVTDITGKPLMGASVVWENTTTGTTTNEAREFAIADKTDGERTLLISFVGFSPEKIKVGKLTHWTVQLIEDATITEVNITAKGQATRFANEPAKVEVLGVREIQRAACCSLAGCFSTNSNVDANVTNIVTDAKELRILGLSGVYNQVLVDGLPLIQGLAYPYGPGSYPGTMIEKIFVTKGANSVLQGFESISGQINIEFHRPENAPKLFLNAFANSFGESQYNANYMVKKQGWSNLTVGHLTLPASIIDRDGDGFRDIVRTNRVSVYNRWSYDNAEKPRWLHTIGVRYLNENREGGTTSFDSGRLGSSAFYGQHVRIGHGEAYTKTNYVVADNMSLILLNSTFLQKQESYFGVKKYVGDQFNLTSALYMDYYYGTSNHNVKLGLSHRHNKLKEDVIFLQDVPFLNYEGTYRTDYDIPGAFAENKLTLSKFTILTGLRADRFGDFGWKLTPRVLVRANLSADTDIRFNAGKGYRMAHIFAENANLLAGNRDLFIDNDLAPEEAINVGLNFVQTLHWNTINITLSGDAYHTYFQNQIFPDYDKEVNTAIVQNFFGRSVSKSYQLENKWIFTPQFDVKLAYNFLEVYREVEGIKQDLPFIPRHKWTANTSYSTPNDHWQIDLTYRWIGSKRMPSTENYPEQYRQPASSDPYQQLDFQLTHRWTDLQIYGGIENIFDFRQDFPILGYDQPFGNFFDPAFNWGPTKGREFYLGVRYSVK
ncbi:MAG: carboxypeptidase-like regulatory domain-containing protein [Saprospiraceae bacterium]|nr:carboxypeptidase-like regulatory domain-containing protein [Saprospiraceae bacterium]